MNRNIQSEQKISNICTMLVSHLTNLGNNFDFFNSKFFDNERNLEKILILEMIEILNNENSINQSSDNDCFSKIYKYVYI